MKLPPVLHALGVALTCMVGGVSAAAAGEAVARSSDWLGSVVVAPNGEELGTIRDLAIDDDGGIAYIVVSVGSFLIENNLIAVAPDALVEAGDHRWVLDADIVTLRSAERFATDGTWPARAGVVRRAAGVAAAPEATYGDTHRSSGANRAGSTSEPAATSPDGGTATIVTGTKTAFLSADERYIKEVEPETPAPRASSVAENSAGPRPTSVPGTRFERLDRDGDGVLNRSEIAFEMGPRDKYSKLDANANGVIEAGEYDELIKQREAQQ